MASYLLVKARVPCGALAALEPPAEERDIGCGVFFGGGALVFAASLGHGALGFQGWKRKGQKETRF